MRSRIPVATNCNRSETNSRHHTGARPNGSAEEEMKMKTKITKKTAASPLVKLKARIAKFETRIRSSNERAARILEKNKQRTEKIKTLKTKIAELSK
jgi:hypothetical protein